MNKQRLQELAGVQLNEDSIEQIANEPTDDIIEALAMHFVLNDFDDSMITTNIKTLQKYVKNFREQKKDGEL